MGFRSVEPDAGVNVPMWGPAPFQFVHHVNIGPYFIRKQCYEALGGWDYSFSRAGEPGICFESELCLRAWINGYRVGYSFVPFKGPPGHYPMDGGTVLFSDTIRRENQVRNHEKIVRCMAVKDTELTASSRRKLIDVRDFVGVLAVRGMCRFNVPECASLSEVSSYVSKQSRHVVFQCVARVALRSLSFGPDPTGTPGAARQSIGELLPMNRVLVAGAGGFIGGHLVRRLKDDGFWVRAVDLKTNRL